jgi:hypothetical protein
MVRTHIDFSFRDDELSFMVRAVTVEYRTHKVHGLTIINETGAHSYKPETLADLLRMGEQAVVTMTEAIIERYKR